MNRYARIANQPVPQSEPLDERQVKNNAGGYAYPVDDWALAYRFLILGTEGGSYYVGERKLTQDAARAVARCLDSDPQRMVDMIRDVSVSGRAPRQEAGLFALAMAASHPDVKVRWKAFAKIDVVCRTASTLFSFLSAATTLRGWGAGFKEYIQEWYNSKDLNTLAYQVIKYRNRAGWTHRDVLRVAHPKTDDKRRQALYRWIVRDTASEDLSEIKLIEGFMRAQHPADEQDLIQIIDQYDLTWEMVPDQFLKSREVWAALLPNLPPGALLRKLNVLSACGLLTTGAWDEIDYVRSTLTDLETLKKARLHPINLLAAWLTYKNGQGGRGSLTWTPVPAVTQALEDGFYTAFGAIEPAGKRFMLAIDTSASMSWQELSNIPGLTPYVAAGVLAMATARTEARTTIGAFSNGYSPLQLSGHEGLREVVQTLEHAPHGGTDCAAPIVYAAQHKIPVDVFAVYTDNETWKGSIHPAQALRQYRQVMGIDAKLAVSAMVANEFSIADPADPGMMDFIGFDLNLPNAIAAFAKLGDKNEVLA